MELVEWKEKSENIPSTDKFVAKEDYAKAVDELDAARNEIASVRAQVNEAAQQVPEEASQSLAKLQSENDELRSELGKVKAASASSSNPDSNEATKLEELQTQLAEYEQNLETSHTEKCALEDQVGAFQEEINAKSASMRKMQQELKAANEQAEAASDLKQANEQLLGEKNQLSCDSETNVSELKRIRDEQIELKQQLAAYNELSEKWDAERLSLYTQLGLDENGEPLEDAQTTSDKQIEPLELEAKNESLSRDVSRLESALSDGNVAFGELQKRFKHLQNIVDSKSSGDDESVLDGDVDDQLTKLTKERDRAVAAAAEASATIARLMTELSQSKADDSGTDQSGDVAQIAKLQTENKEFRRSVAELHAVANEFEELKLARSREQNAARDRLQQAAAANAELSTEVAALKKQFEQTDQPTDELQEKIEQLNRELEKRDKKIAQLKKTQVKAATTVKKKPRAKPDNGKLPTKASPPPKKRTRNVSKAATKKKRASSDPQPSKDKNLGLVFQKKPGTVDDLKQIVGVGPVLEKRLNSIGIYQFRQVRDWTKRTVEYLDEELSLGGRISREDWIVQAKKLAKQKKS